MQLVSGTGIRIRDLFGMSLLPKPLDNGSRLEIYYLYQYQGKLEIRCVNHTLLTTWSPGPKISEAACLRASTGLWPHGSAPDASPELAKIIATKSCRFILTCRRSVFLRVKMLNSCLAEICPAFKDKDDRKSYRTVSNSLSLSLSLSLMQNIISPLFCRGGLQ